MKFQTSNLRLQSEDGKSFVTLVKWFAMPDGWYGYTGTMQNGRELPASFFPNFAWMAVQS